MSYKLPSDAMRRVSVARERIARRNPFFASIMFNAKMVETDEHKTIVTDGINIYFNADYVAQNDPYIEGNVLKCIMKCALQHLGRRKYRELKRWNESSNLSTGQLVHQYFPEQDELMADDGKFPEKSAEEIYDLLEDEEGDDDGEEDGDGESPGDMIEPQDPDQAEQAGKQWARSVANAAEKAQKAGNMPGNIKRLIEELLPVEKLNWRDLIRDMSRDAKSRSSWSWSRPNRRRNDPPMPGLQDDNIYNLIICFDVSGSVSQEMLRDMKSEVAAVMDQDLINQATLIAVDTEPQSIEIVTNSEGVANWQPTGGGGTCFDSALDLINKDYGNSIGMVFLTDLETSSFGKEPPFPVVWVNFSPRNNAKAPYGRTVDYH